MRRILCYGDSNTYGFNALGGRFDEKIRWPKVMESLLGDGYSVAEEGLNGRTTIFDDYILPLRNGRNYLPVSLLTHCPLDLVIIMLGTNDTKPAFSASAFLIARGIEELVKIIKNPYNHNGHAIPEILIVAPAPIKDVIPDAHASGIFESKAGEISRELAWLYEKTAKEYGCKFLDAGMHVKTSDEDGVHLNPEHHAKLAKVMADTVRKIIPQ